MRFFNLRFADDRAVLEHVLQIHQIAVVHVLRKIIGIMKMNNALFMCLYNVLGQQNAVCNIAADFARHVIALHAVHRRIFV